MATKANPNLTTELCRQAKSQLYSTDMWLTIDEADVRSAKKHKSPSLTRWQAKLLITKAQQTLYARLVRKHCSGGEDGTSQ